MKGNFIMNKFKDLLSQAKSTIVISNALIESVNPRELMDKNNIELLSEMASTSFDINYQLSDLKNYVVSSNNDNIAKVNNIIYFFDSLHDLYHYTENEDDVTSEDAIKEINYLLSEVRNLRAKALSSCESLIEDLQLGV